MTSSGLGLQKVINWFSNDKKVSNDEDIDLGDNDVYTLKFIDTKLKSLWKRRDEFVKKNNNVKIDNIDKEIDNIDKEIKTWRLNKLIALNRDDKSIPYGLRSVAGKICKDSISGTTYNGLPKYNYNFAEFGSITYSRIFNHFLLFYIYI